MNILIPMAGAGSRFALKGYGFPKPLIEVCGKPMIEVVYNNIDINGKYIFIIQKQHNLKYGMKELLETISPNCSIIQIEGLTDGAARTTLLAKEYIDNDEELIIANSDQFVDWNPNGFCELIKKNDCDGAILLFKCIHPRCSFAKVDRGIITKVVEKKVISDDATVGIYGWKRGSDYVKYAERMIKKKIMTNGEYYVAPVYQEAIDDGKTIMPYSCNKMLGLGSPEELDYFLMHHML